MLRKFQSYAFEKIRRSRSKVISLTDTVLSFRPLCSKGSEAKNQIRETRATLGVPASAHCELLRCVTEWQVHGPHIRYKNW